MSKTKKVERAHITQQFHKHEQYFLHFDELNSNEGERVRDNINDFINNFENAFLKQCNTRDTCKQKKEKSIEKNKKLRIKNENIGETIQ